MTNALKIVLNCCQLRAVFKFQNRLSSVFCFNDQTLKELTSGVHYVKRVRIRRYSISLLFSPNARKYGKNTDQINSEHGHFLRSG